MSVSNPPFIWFFDKSNSISSLLLVNVSLSTFMDECKFMTTWSISDSTDVTDLHSKPTVMQ